VPSGPIAFVTKLYEEDTSEYETHYQDGTKTFYSVKYPNKLMTRQEVVYKAPIETVFAAFAELPRRKKWDELAAKEEPVKNKNNSFKVKGPKHHKGEFVVDLYKEDFPKEG